MPGCGDALVPQEALQVGDIHSQCKQPRGHRVPQQVRVDALGDPGCLGHPSDDLADALAGQGVRHGAGTRLPAGEQRPGPAGVDVQAAQSSPHFALAMSRLNRPALERASLNFSISGASLCSGMFGMSS